MKKMPDRYDDKEQAEAARDDAMTTPKELADRLLSYANDLECEYGKDHHANKGWLKDLRQASKYLRQLQAAEQKLQFSRRPGKSNLPYIKRIREVEAERDQYKAKCDAWEPVIRRVVDEDGECEICGFLKIHHIDCPVPAAREKLNGESK